MMNYKLKLLDINFLVMQGFNILEVEIDSEINYFQTNDFEPPSVGSVMSAPYMTFTGVNITEFIRNSGFNQMSTEIYKNSFNKLVLESRKISYKFSERHNWRFYS